MHEEFKAVEAIIFCDGRGMPSRQEAGKHDLFVGGL